MSNMSYCRYHNTALDMSDIVHQLEEAGYEDDLSEDEQENKEWLVKLCERYLQAIEVEAQNKIDIEEEEKILGR